MIYFLLARGERAHWHRVDAAEVWNWYAGASFVLEIAQAAGGIERVVLADNVAGGEPPQAMVRAHAWQAAHTLGDWTLVGCTVAPDLNSPDLNWRRRGGSRTKSPSRAD